MTYIPDTMRQQVIERAGSLCEYCRVHQHDSLYSHEVDHIIPEKHRGETHLDNLCLACLSCNRNKGVISLHLILKLRKLPCCLTRVLMIGKGIFVLTG